MDKNRSDVQLWEVSKKVDFDYRIVALVILLIILLSVVSIRYSKSENFMKANDIFSKGFTVINFVLIIYVIYINIQYNSSNDERANRQESYKISKFLWSDTMDNMVKYFPDTYIFYNQIDKFDERTEDEIMKDIKPNQFKMNLLNYYFSNIIVQNLEDFINLKKYLTTVDHISWMVTFYTMFQSSILQKNWIKAQLAFAQNTSNVIQQFVDIGKKAKQENLNDEQVVELLKKVKL